MSKESARDELAQIVHDAQYGESDVAPRYWPLHIYKAADSIQSAGFLKPKVLGYVVVGRHGRLMGGGEQYLTRTEAQDVADEWTRDAENNDVDWDYRVAEITEPTA